MPYTEPVYNLKCDFHYGQGFGGIRIADVGDLIEADIPCNLSWGRRVMIPATGGTSAVGVNVSLMTLLFPSSFSKPVGPTDPPFGPGFVWVKTDIPCWYWIWSWDYIGAGFDNEHCGALIMKAKP